MKYQVIIIGGGPAGYTAAEAAAKGGLSVLLIEKNSLGGVCLNEGCIPTKTLLYSAKTYDSAKHASKYAVNIPEAACRRSATTPWMPGFRSFCSMTFRILFP